MAKLILMACAGSNATKQVDLSAPQTRIGRGADSDIVIDRNQVSRSHAALEMVGPFVTITDLASRNGVFVNGNRVESQLLRDGDNIVIGDCQIRFLAGDEDVTDVEAMRLTTIPGLLADLQSL